MTKVKQLVIEALRSLPDEATFDDITDEVAFLRRGEEEVKHGKIISSEEMKRRLHHVFK